MKVQRNVTPPVPVSVNGVVIDTQAIGAEAQNHPAPKGKPGWAWKAAARALVVRELLLQEARARQIAPSPAEIEEGLWETDDEALIRQLLDEAIQPSAIDEDALRAIYDAHPERFHGPSLFEAAHILFAAAPGDTQARTQAKARAEVVLAGLRREPRRFAELAAEHSACSSRTSGGMLGQVASGDTVAEFEAALCTMEEGAFCDAPVETRYGFHLIRLDARAHGAVLPYEAVAGELRQAQEKAGWVRASRAYVDSLLAQAEVTGIDIHERFGEAPRAVS